MAYTNRGNGMRKLTTRQARAMSAARKTHSGGRVPGPGRPKSTFRCHCGLMTTRRALKRGHKCGARA